MATKKEEVQVLVNQIHNILEEYRVAWTSIEESDISTTEALTRVTNILKHKSYDRKVAILKDLKKDVEGKIAKNKSSREILNSLEACTSDIISKNVKKVKAINSDFKYLIKKDIKYLFEQLKDYDRDGLVDLEKMLNNKIKNESGIFKEKKARGEILGSLNKGMYEKTKTELVEELKSYGVKVSSSDRFIEGMNNELLKYRIVGMYITYRGISKKGKKIESSIKSKDILSNEYNDTKEKVKNLGEILKKEYKKEYGHTPREELIQNIGMAQITIPGVFKIYRKK